MRSLGYEVIYPTGCRELNECLKVDELRRRLNDISAGLDTLAEETQNGDDSVSVEVIPNNHAELMGLFLLLTSTQYTTHDDVDIQLRSAVCACKMLKLFCPYNPYTELADGKALTKAILIFMLKCIGRLAYVKTKGDVEYPKLHNILYICCQVDLFTWCSSLGESKILFEFIKTTFSIIKSISVWTWTDDSVVRQMILDMIARVISDAEALISQEMVTFLLELLIEPAKSTQPEQHTLARDLILRLARYFEYPIQMVLQHSLITKVETQTDSVENTNVIETSVDEIDENSNAHDRLGERSFLVIYALHTIQDSIIAPILPTVELKLKSPSERDRKRAFRLLARLFSEPNSMLPQKCPNLWLAFLGRFNDISKEVRRLCIQMVPQLLKQNPDLCRDPLISCIRQRSHDPEEDIRLLAMRTVANLVSDPIIDNEGTFCDLLGERIRDTNFTIRKEAAISLAGVYKQLCDKADHDQQEGKLASILNSIMHMYYFQSLDDRITVERIFKSSFVPYNTNTIDRVRAFFICYGLMDEASTRVMQEMFKAQSAITGLIRDVLRLLSEQEGKKISNQLGGDLMDRLHHLANLLPKTDKSVMEYLKRFFNQIHSDRTLRTLLMKLIKPGSSCVQAANTMRDLLKRISGTTGTHTDAHRNYVRTIKTMIERCAPVLFDKEFGQEFVTQLIVIRESAGAPGSTGLLDIKRALRLVHAFAVYFKKILPTDEVMDYLVRILSDDTKPEFIVPQELLTKNSENMSSSKVDQNPPTVQELALKILCCLLGSRHPQNDSDSTGSQSTHPESHFTGSESSLGDDARAFLPVMAKFCCTGMTDKYGPVSPMGSESKTHPLGKKTKSSQNEVRARNNSSIMSIEAQLYLTGLAWRRERRRAKLATKVLLALLKAAQRFRVKATPKKPSAPTRAENFSVDLDAEENDEEVEDHDNLGEDGIAEDTGNLSSLEIEIRKTLDDVMKTCTATTPQSNNYIACMTTMGCIALNLPRVYNRQFKEYINKFLIQHVLTCESNEVCVQSGNGDLGSETGQSAVASALWLDDGYISRLTRSKISAIKLMANWLRGLKIEIKPVVQAVIRLLQRIIIHEGDLTRQGKLLPGEMSRLRLVAAVSWIKLAHSQSYVEAIELDWYQSMTYILCDPCAEVRSHFLSKLNHGLYHLRLPLEYMAMFAHAADVPNNEFRQRAKQLLATNVQRRRDFLDRHPRYLSDAKFLYGLLPEFVLPYLIYLLAHDPEWSTLSDPVRLKHIKSSMWFVMEPIVTRGHSFIFLRKVIEKIKHTRDASAPDDNNVNTKLYITCDIALGLLLSRCSDLTLKEYPVDVKLPKSRFVAAPPEFRNQDFAQLLDPTLNPASISGNGKPLIQFTPTKASRAVKQGLMPTELLKEPLKEKRQASSVGSSDPAKRRRLVPATDEDKTTNLPTSTSNEAVSNTVNDVPVIQHESAPMAKPMRRNIRQTSKKATTQTKLTLSTSTSGIPAQSPKQSPSARSAIAKQVKNAAMKRTAPAMKAPKTNAPKRSSKTPVTSQSSSRSSSKSTPGSSIKKATRNRSGHR